jgi:DNA-directed RNA polymerase specialized sigma24 family protein
MPVKDIARAMKKSQIGVRTLLHRARLKLGGKLRAPARSVSLSEKEEKRHALLNL